jgi:glutaredoxin 3
MQVTIYTTPACPYCQMAKAYLTERGVPFTERDVAADPAAVAELVARTGQRGVPVILYDGQVVVGFDRAGLERLVATLRQRRPSLGLSVADASQIALRQGKVPVFGAYVGRVRPGSVAERMGLQPGDIITEFNIRPIRSAADLEAALNTLESGHRVTLVVQRGDRTFSTEATV